MSLEEVEDLFGGIMKDAGLEMKWSISAEGGGPIAPGMAANLEGLLDDESGEIKPEAQNNPKLNGGPQGVSVTVPRPVGKHCANCRQINDLMKCSGCQEVRYCGVICQRKQWNRHKAVCGNKPDKTTK